MVSYDGPRCRTTVVRYDGPEMSYDGGVVRRTTSIPVMSTAPLYVLRPCAWCVCGAMCGAGGGRGARARLYTPTPTLYQNTRPCSYV